jgi:hypothetical protein
MQEEPIGQHGGIHFRLTDGSVYFIRDEVLQACKVEGDELKGAEYDLVHAVGMPAITESVYIERYMEPLEFASIGDVPQPVSAVVAPTIMCCW